MKKIGGPFLILLAIFVVLAPFVFYTIDETEQAVIQQFGKPIRVIVNRVSPGEFEEIAAEIRAATEASVNVGYGSGLYMRVPFIQTVRRMEARMLEFDEQPRDIVTVDKYQLNVDSYARWRIRNPLQFFLRVQDREKATLRLRAIVGSELRKELGRQSHYEIIRSSTNPIQVMGVREGEYELYSQRVKEGREVLMKKVTESCDDFARKYGIEVVDVRIKRADLPAENEQSVFRRMIEERNRIANRYRMEGSRESDIITSETDRKVKAMLAEAEKESLRIRGEADAEAAKIFWEGYDERLPDGGVQHVEGFGADPDFFKFYRSLQALKNSIGQQDRLILSSDSPLFEMFNPESLSGQEP